MSTNEQWLERVTLIAEYRACVEHYRALASVNLDFARRDRTEAARLNCAVAKARLAEHKTRTRQLNHRNSSRRALTALAE
jgi:hypothetical protein